MQRVIIAVFMIFMALPAHAAKKKPVVKPLTEEQKTIYAIGLVFARQLEVFDFTPAELRLVRKGLNDGARGRKPKADFAVYSKKSQDLAIARRDAHGKKLAPLVPAFMAHEAAKDGAVRTESGLIFQPLREGEGVAPALNDKVKVEYRSTLIDGKEMESTYKTGPPDAEALSDFLKCLIEGIQLMKPGGKARIICPPELALGKESNGVIPPESTLVFEVELREVVK